MTRLDQLQDRASRGTPQGADTVWHAASRQLHRRATNRRRARAGAGLVAAAAVTTFAFTVLDDAPRDVSSVVAADRTDDLAASPSPAAEPLSLATSPAFVPGGWVPVDDAGGVFADSGEVGSRPSDDGSTMTSTSGVTVSDIVTTPDGLIAVGHIGEPFQSIGAAWESPDGSAWTRVGADTFGSLGGDLGDLISSDSLIEAAAERGGVVIGAGGWYPQDEATGLVGHPTVWRRDATGVWQRLEGVLIGGGSLVTVDDVAATNSGFVIAATDNLDGWSGQGNQSLLWHSAMASHGHRWDPTSSQPAHRSGRSPRRETWWWPSAVAVGSPERQLRGCPVTGAERGLRATSPPTPAAWRMPRWPT